MEVKFHPFAEVFPLLDEKALQELADDIKANGQQVPILASRGVIIDGRNRLKACVIAGVEPILFINDNLTEAEIVSAIISANLHRRHLTTQQQRAHIAAGLATGTWGGDRTKPPSGDLKRPTQAEAAAAMRVSKKSVERAAQIKRVDPEAHQAALRGDKVVRQAKQSRPIKCAAEPAPANVELPAASVELQVVILTAIRSWLPNIPTPHRSWCRRHCVRRRGCWRTTTCSWG
jgi:hypothetical protein